MHNCFLASPRYQTPPNPSKAGPTVDEAKDAGQKAGWAEGDADALVKVATEVLPKIDTKSAEVAEQAPVYVGCVREGSSRGSLYT